MALDELNGQTRLSDTTTTDYYELVLAEELATCVSTRCRDDKTAGSSQTFEAIAAIESRKRGRRLIDGRRETVGWSCCRVEESGDVSTSGAEKAGLAGSGVEA